MKTDDGWFTDTRSKLELMQCDRDFWKTRHATVTEDLDEAKRDLFATRDALSAAVDMLDLMAEQQGRPDGMFSAVIRAAADVADVYIPPSASKPESDQPIQDR